MNYVESFNLFGVEAMQIPCIRGYGAPTIATEGSVGLFYMDRDTGTVYKCIAATDDMYTWDVFDGNATPQMYGAVGDGVSDDTKAINDCLANNKRVYIPEGTYVIDPAVSLIMQNNQVLEMSENAIIKASVTDETKYNYAISVKNAENVTIRGGKICGDRLEYPDSTLERGYGIYIYNSRNVNIECCEISDFRGDCVVLESIKGASDVYSDIVNRNIKISDCKIHNALRHGITVMGVYGFVVKDTEIFNTQGKTYSCSIDAEVHYEWQEMKDIHYENVRAYDSKLGMMFNRSNQNGAIKNVSISRCDFTRVQFDMDGDVDIDWSDIRSISVGNLDSFTISHSNLILLFIRPTAKKVTANKCVFECTESNPQALSFEWASDESTVECEFNDCVFKSYTSNVRDVSAEKRLFNIQLAPVTFMLNGCTFYVNNPNGAGIGAREWAKAFGCRFIYKFNAEGYTEIFFNIRSANNYVVGNVFDTMEVEAKYYDKPIIACDEGDLFFTNNIGVMTKMVGSYLTSVGGEGTGRTCSIINNVFTAYWGKGYNNPNVTYVHIGNVYADTTD